VWASVLKSGLCNRTPLVYAFRSIEQQTNQESRRIFDYSGMIQRRGGSPRTEKAYLHPRAEIMESVGFGLDLDHNDRWNVLQLARANSFLTEDGDPGDVYGDHSRWLIQKKDVVLSSIFRSRVGDRPEKRIYYLRCSCRDSEKIDRGL